MTPLVLEQVSTLAGVTGGPGHLDGERAAARFREPRGVVREGPALYVVDAGNAAIRRLDLATGAVTTLAAGAFTRLTGAIASDGTRLYVGDGGAVRTVALDGGAVGTLAGRADEGGFADGDAVTARLSEPGGLAVDRDRLWVADTGNGAVRVIALETGEVATVAGRPGPCAATDGPAATARFCRPTGIAVAGSRVLVADTGNDVIRSVDAGTGDVATLAGSAGHRGTADGIGTRARLEAPAALATDGSTLWVLQPRAIRAVSLDTGAVITFAGAGASAPGAEARLDGAAGLASDGAALYIADAGAHAVAALDLVSRTLAPLAGAPVRHLEYGAPLLDSPAGLAGGWDALYVADTGNHVVRRLAWNAEAYDYDLTTVAGAPRAAGAADGVGADARFTSPRGVAAGADAVYVADTGNHTVRRLDLATLEVTTLAGLAGVPGGADGTGGPGGVARLSSPTALALGDGFLVVADTANHTVRRLDLATLEVMTIAGLAGEPGAADGPGGDSRLDSPRGLAVLGDAAFVADTGNGTIRRLDLATGDVTTLAGSPGEHGIVDGVGPDARFDRPVGLAVSTYDTYVWLYVADEGYGDDLRWVNPATGTVYPITQGYYGWMIPTRYPTLTVAIRPGAIVSTGWSWLVADEGGHTIRSLDGNHLRMTIAGTELAPGHADGRGSAVPLGSPAGLACDGDRIFVTDRGNGLVRAVGADGAVSIVAGPGTDVWGPTGAVVLRHVLYVSDELRQQILIIDGLQQVRELAGIRNWTGLEDGPPDLSAFSSPWGLASDGAYLYVADTYNSAVRRVSLLDGWVDTVAGGPGNPDLFLPVGLALDGDTLYVSDAGRAVVRQVSLATGEVTTLAGAVDSPGASDGRGEEARFDAPMGLALHGRTLYVADARNRAVRGVDVETGEVATVAGGPAAEGLRDGPVSEAAFLTPVAVCVIGDALAVLDAPGYARWPATPLPSEDAAVRLIGGP